MVSPMPNIPSARDEVDDASRRRRGSVLEQAIFEAVIAELGAVGFDALTFEGIAERARTGRSVLYRRWRKKSELVLDALVSVVPMAEDFHATKDLRADLLRYAEQLRQAVGGPETLAMLTMANEGARDPELAVALRERVINPRRHVLLALLHRHAAIGNVASDAIKPEVVDALPGLLFITYITNGGDVPPQSIVNIIDHVMIPLLTRLVPSRTGKPRR